MAKRKAALDVMGFLVQPELKARGGVQYRRVGKEEKEVEGRKERTVHTTEKLVDDRELLDLSTQIINRAQYILSRHCTNTPIGWFADEEMLDKLDHAFDEIRTACREFNAMAETVGSKRRVDCEIYTLEVRESNERVAARLAKVVRDKLDAARTAFHEFHNESFTAFDDAREQCRNLHRLAVGIQADSIAMAVAHLNEAKREARRIADDERKPLAEVVKAYNMDPVVAAISLFQPIDREGLERALNGDALGEVA